jgi:hypothetical protein
LRFRIRQSQSLGMIAGAVFAFMSITAPAQQPKETLFQDVRVLDAVSGPRSPYQGKLGVIETGALADLLLVEGNLLEAIDLVTDPQKNFSVCMKDGIIFKGDAAR